QGHDGLFENPIEIPDVALLVLEIPDEIARLRPQCDRRIGVQSIVVGYPLGAGTRLEQRRRVIGIADAEIDEVELRVVAADRPDAGTEALLDRRSVPGVSAGLAGPRDGVEAPALCAASRVEADDVAPAGVLC